MAGPAGRGALPPTRTIVVYKNGDAFFPGRKVVVNPRHLSTFDNFLTSLSRGTESPFGAVRRLYTPAEGHRARHLDDLKHGGVYVAAGNEQFKQLDYCEITTKKPQKKRNEPIRPVVHSSMVVSARWGRTAPESCTLNVFTNGDVFVAPVRIRIPKYTLRSWENVLAMVTEKVRLRTGAVYRLCTLDGRPVSSAAELQNNQRYVAVGAEKFKALPYGHCASFRDPIRENHGIQGRDVLPAAPQTRRPEDPSAHTGFREDLEHTARGHMKKQAKPQRSQQQRQASRKPVLLSTGEGSVFNAQNKRSETVGAAEVQEDGQLKVDLPIDQVEARIVEEEYDGSYSASPCKASLHDASGSLSAGSRNNEAKEREVSSRLGRVRSRVSRFFKAIHMRREDTGRS